MRFAICLACLMGMNIAIAAGPGIVTPLAEASLQLPQGELRAIDLYDGRAKATVQLVRQGEGWGSADGKLTLSLQSTRRPGKGPTASQHEVAITNRGSVNAWLLVRAYRSFKPPAGASWQYFNGNFSATPRQPTVRDQLPHTMPMVAASGLGLGIEPLQIFSYLENGIVPPTQANAGSFYYGVKVVIDPGKTETISFVTFPATGTERSVVAAYQRLYPAAFSPIPDGDPRLQTSGEAGAAATWYKPSPEAVRRSMSGCDWCYAPLKIAGDWFGRPQFWDKYNENIPDEKTLNERYGTLEHWHDFLKETFHRTAIDHGVAPYFYTCNWHYYKLAEEHYPDAMVTDPKALNRIAPWVNNKGPDVRMYLWGNKAAEQYQQDLRDIWAAYPLSGFGHDVTEGNVKFRGAGMAVSPGRAWDDEGEYVDVSVGIAKTLDFMHALPKKSYRPGVWANGAEHVYSIAVRCDAGSFEGARYELPGLDTISRYRRYILGSKAIQLFSSDSRDHTTDYYDEENTSPEDIKLMYRRIQLGSMQACLKWGALPCSDLATGWQESWELYDLADRELYPYPWQLNCEATAEGDVDVAQYGTGANARFVVMNPRGQEVETKLSIGGGKMVYALADGGETANIMTAGSANIPLKLSAAGVAMLVPVAQTTARGGTLQVARKQDPEDGLRVNVSGDVNSLKPILPAGYELCTDLPWPWHFSRKLFASNEKELLDFFADYPSVQIAFRPEASLVERKSAEAVQEYFRFYSEEVQQKPRVVLPIVTEGTGKAVRLAVAAQPTIRLDGDSLVIQAPEQDLLDTTRELLRLLDRRYPFYGQIGRWVHQRPIETKLRQKLGLGGGTVLEDGSILTTPNTAWLFNSVAKGPAYGKPW